MRYILAILLVISGISTCAYHKAGYDAKVINQQFGTSYTQDEVFWSRLSIAEFYEVERRRIELNGNIFTGEESAK